MKLKRKKKKFFKEKSISTWGFSAHSNKFTHIQSVIGKKENEKKTSFQLNLVFNAMLQIISIDVSKKQNG